MKKILIIILLSPIALRAQKLVPRFENDTLYTTSGYKIFPGQTLTFSEGTGKKGKFRSAKIKGRDDNDKNNLTDASVIVKELSDFYISGIGNAYIRVIGSKIDSDKKIEFNLAFDMAIEGFPGLPGELIVPDEFKTKKKGSVSDEINKLYKLYQDNIITKEEFEAQKKKLLEQ